MDRGKLRDGAIEAVRDYLVGLLDGKDFCQARRVGKALELLVEERLQPTQEENVKQASEKRSDIGHAIAVERSR